MRNLVKDRPDISRTQVERILDLMNVYVRDCLVTGYEPPISTVTLPDADDRHVLAAAIQSGAEVILTFNLKDFPVDSLRPHGVVAEHPDEFLSRQLHHAQALVRSAAKRQRSSLKDPPMSVDQYLTTLERQGLPRTVAGFRKLAHQL
jgi:hypothetical protein